MFNLLLKKNRGDLWLTSFDQLHLNHQITEKKKIQQFKKMLLKNNLLSEFDPCNNM